MTAAIRIVLVDPSHPGNVGSVARAMKTMGLDDLTLVRPKSFPHADATALAAGAGDLLARARVVDTVPAAVADCGVIAATTSRPRSHYWEILTPRDMAARVIALPGSERVALLFGSERYGLATEELQRCNVLINIPANPHYCSLNLAMAVQILSYELWLAREQPASRMQTEMALASATELERLYEHLQQVLTEVDFQDRTGGGHLMTRIRRLFNRAQLDQNEVNILRGILTAVQGKRRTAGAERVESSNR
jgi:TrmH family RNA methyltransferase